MAIRTVVTRGYGNGTFNGTIPLVVRRGYASSVVAGSFTLNLDPRTSSLALQERDASLTLQPRGLFSLLPRALKIEGAFFALFFPISLDHSNIQLLLPSRSTLLTLEDKP